MIRYATFPFAVSTLPEKAQGMPEVLSLPQSMENAQPRQYIKALNKKVRDKNCHTLYTMRYAMSDCFTGECQPQPA